MSRTVLWACALACFTMPDSGIQSVAELTQTPSASQVKSSDALSALYDENKDRDARETIIRAAAEHGGDRGRAFLLKIARQDPDVELREVAIRHLAERGDTAVLLELFDSEKNSDLKETILRQLAERDDEVARRKVQEVARTSSDMDLRETAIRLIAERGDTGLVLQLFDAEKNSDIKETLLRLVAERDDDVSRKKLLEVARTEKDPELRETAVRLIGERGNVSALITLFDGEKDADVKETIVRLLEESSDAKATEKLLAIARSDPDENVREVALRVIAERAARRQ
jgi:uncharacterized protein YrzB (UPF0473 family)